MIPICQKYYSNLESLCANFYLYTYKLWFIFIQLVYPSIQIHNIHKHTQRTLKKDGSDMFFCSSQIIMKFVAT